MKCPACGKNLIKKRLDKFDIADCDFCKGIWVDSFTFESLKEFESPFSALLDAVSAFSDRTHPSPTAW